jgi:hypothetical protein
MGKKRIDFFKIIDNTKIRKVINYKMLMFIFLAIIISLVEFICKIYIYFKSNHFNYCYFINFPI